MYATNNSYYNTLRELRRNTTRHTLVLEVNMNEDDKRHIFHYADLLRKASNEVIKICQGRYKCLIRTKKYRALIDKYKRTSSYQALNEIKKLIKLYRLLEIDIINEMLIISKKYKISDFVAKGRASEIARALNKLILGDGKKLHFLKKGVLPSIKGDSQNQGIVLEVNNTLLKLRFQNKVYTLKERDDFQRAEASNIIKYLNNPKYIDGLAVKCLKENNKYLDTFRPFNTLLKCQVIRGRLRIYAHISVDGKPCPKLNKNGELKHKYGIGKIGLDIGTQSFAYTSNTKIGIANLAERGHSFEYSERMLRLLNRALDRSRRATNPNNYNEDGTIRMGPKKWVYSKRYNKLYKRLKCLERRNSINRHIKHNEDINMLRELGNILITEKNDTEELKRRIEIKNLDGTISHKKHYGKSVKNRSSGYFQSEAKRKFISTGGKYIEVGYAYRASQYDHTSNKYIKHELNERMLTLSDGSIVQRDLYSSFLLYSIDSHFFRIDRNECIKAFSWFKKSSDSLINEIRFNKIKILNSGI